MLFYRRSSCLIYVMFASSLSPVVCRRALVLFTLCSGRLYLQLFVGGLLSYLRYVRVVFTPVVCRRALVLFTLCSLRLYLQVCRRALVLFTLCCFYRFVGALVLFTLCSLRLYLQLFVGGLLSYLRYVRVVFISSCL